MSESEPTIQSSTGISVTKTANFANPFAYKYFFSPYIFGKQQPIGFTDPVITDSDLTTFGALRSAFTVDPLANGAGSWWKQTYNQYPDVALNHPNRWDYTSLSKPNTIPVNCVGIDTFTMNCVTPAERDPENPWGDQFHDMRGFFITDARSPGQGPQLQLATDSDKLSLQTRVYNYSRKAMPAGTQVKVRFYGMEWNTQNAIPADAQLDTDGKIIAPGGQSFLIGKSELNPIAPFSDDSNAPLNWVTAGTTFDTTNHGGKDLVFWVVVWMEDANGNLVQELPGKGLTTTSPFGYARFSDLTELEQMVANPLKADPSDPDMVSFSNNIGFYRLPIYIQSKASATALRATAAKAGNRLDQVKVESVTAETSSIKLGKAAKIHAMLLNGAESVPGLTVYFYDDDPAAGGKLFDAERLAHIRPNSKHKVSVVYNPQQCGAHQVFVKVTAAGEVGATGSAAQAFQVKCPTPVCTAQVCMRSPQYYALHTNQLPRGVITVAGSGLLSNLSTSNTVAIKLALQGGNATQQYFNQQFVALQLNLLSAVDPGGRAEQSNLACYKVNFQPAQLSTGFTLSPSATIGEILTQARMAAQRGQTSDLLRLANVMYLIHGNDPSGRCR